MFKVGDYVRCKKRKDLIYTILFIYRNEKNVIKILNHKNDYEQKIYSNDIELWSPISLEFCWFTNELTSIPFFDSFNYKDDLYVSNHTHNGIFKWKYCHPFLGTLPKVN